MRKILFVLFLFLMGCQQTSSPTATSISQYDFDATSTERHITVEFAQTNVAGTQSAFIPEATINGTDVVGTVSVLLTETMAADLIATEAGVATDAIGTVDAWSTQSVLLTQTADAIWATHSQATSDAVFTEISMTETALAATSVAVVSTATQLAQERITAEALTATASPADYIDLRTLSSEGQVVESGFVGFINDGNLRYTIREIEGQWTVHLLEGMQETEESWVCPGDFVNPPFRCEVDTEGNILISPTTIYFNLDNESGQNWTEQGTVLIVTRGDTDYQISYVVDHWEIRQMNATGGLMNTHWMCGTSGLPFQCWTINQGRIIGIFDLDEAIPVNWNPLSQE